ncbi:MULTISPECIES: hypothetical protein [Burkholderia]|uniref:hypothetical protein n=1 Tax=Burkholderia TaxID=32008 RepID=UPI0015816BB4|nr:MULTISPECIES: hypothetical protein [Burkholderia]
MQRSRKNNRTMPAAARSRDGRLDEASTKSSSLILLTFSFFLKAGDKRRRV